jgi:hypothetical protein
LLQRLEKGRVIEVLEVLADEQCIVWRLFKFEVDDDGGNYYGILWSEVLRRSIGSRPRENLGIQWKEFAVAT